MLSTKDISIIKSLFDEKFEENNTLLDKRFVSIDKRFEVIDKRFEEIDERFDWLGQILKDRFDTIDERFDKIEAKLDRKLDTEEAYGMFGSHDRRISKLEDDGILLKRKLGI